MDPCADSNTVLGCLNIIDEMNVKASVAEGMDNSIKSGEALHTEGSGNVINSVGNATSTPSENCHVEGLTNTVAGYQNHVEGCNHEVNGFQSHVIGCNNKTDARVAGQNLSGYGGYFLYNKSESFGGDIYNYSNQLGGGLNDRPLYPGEGISMIDKTLANGVYPIGQHQSYRNTSDGLSYSIMLKGMRGLKEGIFVTFGELVHKERMLIKAHCSDDVVGVITKSSGFIANAGQMAASTRINYDIFHNPVIKVNKATNSNMSKDRVKHHPQNENDQILFPGFQTELKDSVDRKLPFVPYTEREEYYQVATNGLVVVRSKCSNMIGKKCGIKNGKAVRGCKYWVVKIIDDRHIMILL